MTDVDEIEPVPPPPRCTHCNAGVASRPFVALPNDQTTWVSYYCGTVVWTDEHEARGRDCYRSLHEYVVGADWNSIYPDTRVALSGHRFGVLTGVTRAPDSNRATAIVQLYDLGTGEDKGEVRGDPVTLGLRIDRA